MSYNANFQVKYNDIEQELLLKIKEKTNTNTNESEKDDEYEYSADDICDVCNKLYRDEFLSVFDASDLSDCKIDQGIQYVYNIMMTNDKFKQFIEETTDSTTKEQPFNNEQKESMKLLILISLFSQNVFYITHKCVCQQINSGNIDDALLVELKTHSLDLLKINFGV